MSCVEVRRKAVDRYLTKKLSIIFKDVNGNINLEDTFNGFIMGLNEQELECIRLKIFCEPPMTITEISEKMSYSRASIDRFLKNAIRIVSDNQKILMT